EDPHNLFNKADFVMANPPFNVDEIDADKIKNDPRLPFGLPGVNKKGKVSNGNYVWISYFYSYLTEQGRAGFVMSSQASSAGRGEAKVREKLIDTGDVDIMISIRSNFFYTRAVPCELWFFNKAKPAKFKDKVLMIDARNVFRKVTRKIYDFSPEQLQNILSIIWLYRGENKHFHDLVNHYQVQAAHEAGKSKPAVEAYLDKCLETDKLRSAYKKFIRAEGDNLSLLAKKLQKLIETDFRMMLKAVEVAKNREKQKELKKVEGLKQQAVEQLKLVSYFNHQAQWLMERFPEEKLSDVEGLVKLVDKAELKENDWSLTPGRYVGVAPEEIDPDFDFSETMKTIYSELEDLNTQSIELSKRISENFKKIAL
ncbi:SAM-dependent methyltransferase, partial [Patescibacteria group bacterium]|nr:SAM-dependent methyltransferase [Patescibacteria group bacterium]